jgi:hypothetical protein
VRGIVAQRKARWTSFADAFGNKAEVLADGVGLGFGARASMR